MFTSYCKATSWKFFVIGAILEHFTFEKNVHQECNLSNA